MHSVFDSLKGLLVPIRREAWPFVAILLVVTLAGAVFWQPLFWLGLILTVWCVYFFRDPQRVVPLGPALILSPADGRVSSVGMATVPKELNLGGGTRRRVSIFMNVFNCHVNRAPAAGRIAEIVYTPGKFLNAELDKASEDNERNSIVIDTVHGLLGVVQIAGLVARRIVCDVQAGGTLAPGERIGMIRFGSRLDVYLPDGAAVLVAEGQIAIAGETVIARFGPEAGERASRID